MLYVVYSLTGLIIGSLAPDWGGSALLGALGGAVIGFLLARLNRLAKRIQILEHARTEPDSAPPRVAPATEPDPLFTAVEAPSAPGAPDPSPWLAPPERKSAHQPSLLKVFIQWAGNWISSGNVPVKVGVLISFIGVAFLLKYAIDRELVFIPLEFRLIGVALAGAALIGVGWRLRKKTRVYALSLQGGGAGILFLTIFSALRLWQLLPASLAFVLLIALTFFTGVLAVVQNSRSLAILGIVGGFLAPVLTSTGQGSHVVLFSYYLVLNGAILGIAWFRTWRELNLVGWGFTFLISSYWGYQYFKPALFASTEPFLVLYFLFYQAIAILYAVRQPPERFGAVDGTLVFGTPVIAFALQAELVRNTEYGLAWSAAVAAVFYALSGAWMLRKKGPYLKLMSESFMALAVAFATLAIPLALDARWTAASWALEGAALIWVGVRQQRRLASFAGTLLIFLSGLAFANYGWRDGSGLPLINGNVLGGLLISISALFASSRLDSMDDPIPLISKVLRIAAIALFVWGVLWWLGTAWMEIDDRIILRDRFNLFLLFVALSTVVAIWLARTRQWNRMQSATLFFLPLMALAAINGFSRNEHWLERMGLLAWPISVLVQAMVLHDLDRSRRVLATAWHVATMVLFTAILSIEAAWWVDRVASDAWAAAVASMVTGSVAMLIWHIRRRPAWPVPVHFSAYLFTSLVLVLSQAAGLVMLSVILPGDSSPLSYIPVINPFDLAMLFAALTAGISLSVLRQESGNQEAGIALQYAKPYKLLLVLAFLILSTAALVRGVHHYTTVPWHAKALFDSVVVQTVLSIYWGLLGFTGMILGARHQRRLVWLSGAGFMALVVIKLFLVDLGNSGTVERIISFIGIGALLLLVGYFAPAPPRKAETESIGS